MDATQWSLLASFLMVAKLGSLSKASAKLQVSQSTLSRHIKSLEDFLGFALFDRHARGLSLTPRGVALQARAEAIGGEVDAFFREAVGLNAQVGGTVRVTLSEVAGVRLLMPWAVRFQQAWPQISLDWVITNEVSNLLAREADIAVRMSGLGPQQDLIARAAGSLSLGFYASKSYLARHPHIYPINNIETLRRHTLIGYDQDDSFIRNAARIGEHFVRDDFAFCTDSVLAQIEVIRAGLGVGVMLNYIGEQDPTLERILPEFIAASLPVWVVAHKDVHTNARVRIVFDSLFEEVTSLTST
jgi:DNA-binding transcriptional LysR family regulator